MLSLLFSFQAQAHDYPTVEIVRAVENCMAENGGQTEETLFACTCRFDLISTAFSFDEYEQIVVYARNKDMPGEKGAVFRSPGSNAKALELKFEQTNKDAISACPVARRVPRKVKSK